MKLDLDRTQLGRSELPVSGSLKLAWGEERPETALVQGELVVDNLDKRLLLNGTLKASGTACCGRCLENFELTWDVPVEIMVLRNVDTDEGEGDTLVIQQASGEVDLTEFLRESLVLSYPTATICRTDCLGICSTCGTDLNRGSCQCADDEVDPRWAGLDALDAQDD